MDFDTFTKLATQVAEDTAEISAIEAEIESLEAEKAELEARVRASAEEMGIVLE